ncbi:MAG: c-type cytochrome [Isosphaeraceae bacterium]|nr:c-type cytochrome [Isosphaeraceae bacterium]
MTSKQAAKLEPKFRDKVRNVLEEQCGTPGAVKVLGGDKAELASVRKGAVVYKRYCTQCHGTSGDGNGPAGRYMIPRPRDYRAGIFKFTSTTYGAKPLRDDLIRTVRRGVMGTSMPSFDLLSKADLEAVVDYVLALTRRGELESQLADAAEFDGDVDPARVPELIDGILKKWKAAPSQVVYPATPMPEFSATTVQAGKAAFLSKGCSKCHGDDGRGQTKENIGVDSWGNPTKAADLTSGMLRGGTEPIDLYRHVDSGINGTPMPSFRSAFQQEPETAWNLVSYVLYLSNRRRAGEVPEAGLLKPLPGVEPSSSAPAAESVSQLTR